MWSEKHRPQSIIDMVGNEDARTSFVEWFGKWKKGTKPLLLVGPPGTGKTTLANLAAKQFGYDMISLNASDVRNKNRIQEILNPVLGNTSILGRPMIFVDEVDGIFGRSDYGGAEALIKILKEPTIPIILAANSELSKKMKSIKKVVKTIHLRPLPPRLVQLFLKKILKMEGAKLKTKPLSITEEEMNQCYKKYRAVMGTAGRNMALAKRPLGEIFYLGLARAAEGVGCGNEIEDTIKNKFIKVPSWPLYYSLLADDIKKGFELTLEKSKLYLSDARLALDLLPDKFSHKEFLEFLFLTVEHYNQFWYNQLQKANIWSTLSENLPK